MSGTAATPAVLPEIASIFNFVNGFLPAVTAGLDVFAPQDAAIVAVAQPVFQVLVNALNTVASDTGKPWEQVLQDVVNHLTPGAPGAPSLT